MSITIKKAKIKDFIFLSVEYSEKAKDGTNNVSKDCSAPVHDDLKAAFKRLHVHLALLCCQVTESNKKNGMTATASLGEVAKGLDPEETFYFSQKNWDIIQNIQCNGFAISGNGDNEGVTLSGRRDLEGLKGINLVSPFQKWDGDTREYPYTSELGEVIEACKNEVYMYLFEGKHQPNAQLDLFEQNDENAEQQGGDDSEGNVFQ